MFITVNKSLAMLLAFQIFVAEAAPTMNLGALWFHHNEKIYPYGRSNTHVNPSARRQTVADEIADENDFNAVTNPASDYDQERTVAAASIAAAAAAQNNNQNLKHSIILENDPWHEDLEPIVMEASPPPSVRIVPPWWAQYEHWKNSMKNYREASNFAQDIKNRIYNYVGNNLHMRSRKSDDSLNYLRNHDHDRVEE